MKVSNVLGSLALITAVSFANSAFAAKAPAVTDLGNLNLNSFVDADLIQFNTQYSPEYYTFSLSNKSNVNVDFSALASINLGAKFSLFDSTGSTELQSFNFPTIVVAGGPELTFSNIAAGNYQFRFTSFASLGLGTEVRFSATTVTPVPEPETNALMMVGLGLIGFIARRKFA